MREKLHPKIKLGRQQPAWGEVRTGNDPNGFFRIPGPNKRWLTLIMSNELGWDHVSVSILGKPEETPTWEEMSYVKDLVFEEDEVVMQLHPAKSNYVNLHQGCLHLWRPQREKIPLPPLIMV